MAAFIFTRLQIFLRSLIWLIIGVGPLFIYPFNPANTSGENFVAGREFLFASGIKDLLPVGVRGIMLTGMLAALAFTIDTHLSWGASYWSNDLYWRIINKARLKRTPSNKEQVIVARLYNVLVLAIALMIMANLGSIQTAWYITLLFGAGIGAVLMLRWVWERINLYSEVTAIIVSLIFAPIILFTVEAEWLRLLLMSSISTIIVITTTLLTRPTSDSVLLSFYKQVDPPGFWKNSAPKSSMDPNHSIKSFKGGAYLTVTTSLSVYLLLVGFGKLILPNPASPITYAWIYIILGIASLPLWWKRLFHHDFFWKKNTN